MAAPTVYRWDDTGAPILCHNIDPNGIVSVVKACLINGYGDKTPPGAGYQLEYENVDGSGIAFTSLSENSNGFFHYVMTARAFFQNTTSPLNEYEIGVCEFMTDINTRINSIYDSRLYSNYYDYRDDIVPWVVIADDRFFYVFVYNDYTFDIRGNPNISTMWGGSTGGWGDIVTLAEDPWATISWGYTYATHNGDYFGVLEPTVHVGSRIMRSYLGDTIANKIQIAAGGGVDTQATIHIGSSQGPLKRNREPIVIVRPTIHDENAGSTPYAFRGWAPGFYYPQVNMPYGNLETVTIDGKTFLAVWLKIYSNITGQCLISLDDWRV